MNVGNVIVTLGFVMIIVFSGVSFYTSLNLETENEEYLDLSGLESYEEYNDLYSDDHDLINSPEVYMLDSFQTDSTFSMLNTYVTPVRLTTSSYTRKTIANDKLMQYTFEVEKSKTFRTQSV